MSLNLSKAWITFLQSVGLAPAGGTTGQVLKKINNTDYNYSWQNEGDSDPFVFTWKSSDDYSDFYNTYISSLSNEKSIFVVLEQDSGSTFTIDAGTYGKGRLITFIGNSDTASSIETDATGVVFSEGLPSIKENITFISNSDDYLFDSTSETGNFIIGKDCTMQAASTSPIVKIASNPVSISIYEGNLYVGTSPIFDVYSTGIGTFDLEIKCFEECNIDEDTIKSELGSKVSVKKYSSSSYISESQVDLAGTLTISIVERDPGIIEINEQTDDYIITYSDIGKLIEMNKGTDVTITVPDDATELLPIGSSISVIQKGDGQVEFLEYGWVYAQYSDTPAGTAGTVTLDADNRGSVGNITITGDGSNDVDALVLAWNTANPTNTITVSAGGTEVPNNGIDMELTGGVDGSLINSKDGNLKLYGKFSGGTLTKAAANVWYLVGDLTI